MPLKEAELDALAVRALVGAGLAHADAVDAARILVMADLFGLHTHGLSRIESYAERLRSGGINPNARVRVERVAPAMAKVDGDNGVGPLVGLRALEAATQLARETGVGIALARSSNHFGPVSPYNYLAAQGGFASMACSNASVTIAPWGGREGRFGNSPIGFGVPNPRGQPFLLDMAMSVVARAKIRNALKRGERIPDTWATDRDGNPTSDPKAALDGFLLAIGGHKGYGLALVVDLFAGLLSGAAYLTHVKSWLDEPDEPQDLGHFFLLFDTARLGPADWLAQRMGDFCAILRATPPADPGKPVLVPGDIEIARMQRHQRDGVELEPGLQQKLEAIAAGSQRR
ncbi:MAG TPA: Ldh family oxidoreductase [Usitatibacter sp.]|nr:Ldh family oxidoreductase [Usitatibacter sp.]